MPKLRKQLSARHLSMIALGGTLGTGIFLTSGSALYIAGPMGAIFAYLVMGLMVYLLMNSLGEMSAYKPVSGSFCEYASNYVSKPFGFAMGYNYWFNWSITIAVELIAAALVMGFWYPNVPTIDWCMLFFCGIFLLNILPVKSYGESQYWLSLIKVAAIIIFIIVGVFVIAGFNIQHQVIGFHNWNQGHFHNGISGLFEVFLLSGFAFQGTELIGVAAGEASNPRRNIPRAVKQIFWRILLFYVLIMLLISFIIPYTDPRLLNADNSIALSPFTIIFSMTGLPYITHAMNFIILIALLSACNSDMYSSTRILWNLSVRKSAPKIFSTVNRFGIPIYALLATASFGLIAFLCDLFGSTKLFLMLVNISSLAGFIAWYGIARSHIGFRKHYLAQGKKLKDLPFQSHFYPSGPIIAIVLSLIVIFGQWYVLVEQNQLSFSSFLSTYIGLPFVLLLWFGNWLYHKKR
ncbi:MAG TPA: amino acid permease [Coxiellaceae bacterium]|nr:MAG: lysine transporter [Gammaproteobacteria bacterium RIFCSPHIGHO2_12_FULL_36_30]HLB57131.1 amino acid permease [Coxiellaceae bacterium]